VGERLKKKEQDWIARRLRGLHTGIASMAVNQEDYTNGATLYDKKTSKVAGAVGNFGKIFKAKRKSDDADVVVKYCRVDHEFTHAEDVMLEICFHEALCRHKNIVGFSGTYQTSPVHFGLVLEAFDTSAESWLTNSKQLPLNSMAGKPQFERWCQARAVITGDVLEGLP
jgi:hypothetical protein